MSSGLVDSIGFIEDDALVQFAVIIPVHNTAKYLAECLDSVLAQTYKKFIAFVVDDGSSDGSGNIADFYRSKDSRIQVVHTKNGGVSKARNIALEYIEQKKGFDYVLFLDSDDKWSSDCLETIYKYISNNENYVLSFGLKRFWKGGGIQEEFKVSHPPICFGYDESFRFILDNVSLRYIASPASSLGIGNFVAPCNLIRGIRFDATLQNGEDQDFKMRAILKSKGLIAISDVLLLYRQRLGSLSHQREPTLNEGKYFVKLIQNAQSLSPEVVRVIENRAAMFWWSTLRKCAHRKGALRKNWPEFCAFLYWMQRTFRSGIIDSPRFIKHKKIFSLGRRLVWLYFFLSREKYHKIQECDYFE